ncbi:MAG: PD-(D/E)XK nuclease family protein, partial [Planctomycetes bacterium]|nr:PD-(D/E)XK nuclease family protein [Planctomycetota bacterium]
MAANIIMIVGPARSGKTGRLLLRYRDFLRSRATIGFGSGSLWLAPNQRSVAELRETMVCNSGDAFLEPGFHTFAGFAEAIVAASARRIRPISRLQKRLLLRRIVDRALAEGKLPYLAPVARTPGFIAQLDEWIAEWKRRDVWAEDLCQRTRSRRDRDLAQLYSQYQRLLLQGDLYDAEGRFWAAREILQQHSGKPRHEYGLVVVDGFSDFTTAQFDILRMLAERSAEMLISLAADRDCLEPLDPTAGRALLFAKVRRTFERLRAFLPELSVEFVAPVQQGAESLRRAERNLFREFPEPLNHPVSAENGPVGGPIGLEIVAANGVQSEIEEIARRIKAILLDSPARPQDCVVVFRNLAASAQRVADVFDDFGLPHWIETRPRLTASALVRTAVSLLRLKTQDWPFRLLLEVTGNRTLSIFDEPLGAESRICLERSIRAAQLPSGRQRLLEQLRKWSALESAERQEQVQQAAVALANLQRLADCLDALPEQAAIGAWTEHLAELLTQLGVISGEQSSAAWAVLRKALRSLDLVDAWLLDDTPSVRIEELVELVEMVAEDQRLPATHDDMGRVRVLTAESARHESAPHVFLAGLSEQAFSSSDQAGQPDPEGDPPRSGQPDDSLAEQGDAMYLFYSLVTRADESLTLSYPAMDDKGQQLPPSPLLRELERCFGPAGIPVTTQPLGEVPLAGVIDADELPLSRSAHRQAAVARALDKDQAWLAGIVSQPVPAGAGILDAIGCIASRAHRDQFGEYEGLLLSEAAQAALARRFDGDHLWSPSQLEGYATCPFRFFAEQLLSLSPLGELTLASDAGRRGSLLHQVLATVHQQLSAQAAESPEDQSWQADLAERFRRVLDAEVAATPLGGLEQSLREIERRQIEAWATPYAQQE